MKNTDIAAIILIASLSMLAAYFIADAMIGKPGGQTAKVKTVDKISSDIQEPDASVFNKNAINPTVPVFIGEAAQPAPSTPSTNNTSSSNAASSSQAGQQNR
jgi:hypothetical protein